MSESNAMLEIRKIRDENSLRHLSMSDEELSKEMESSVVWFLQAMGKPVPIISANPAARAA